MFKFNNDNSSTNTPYENKLEHHYKISLITVCVLGVLRIVALDFWSLISDALTALTIWLTYTQKNKLMAIFCFVGAIIGFIHSAVIFGRLLPFLKAKFYVLLVFGIISYSLLVYTYLAVISLFAFRNYTAGCPCQNSDSSSQSSESNYGGYGSVRQDEEGKGFTAFSGKGVAIG